MSFGSRNCGHCSGIDTVKKSTSNNYLTCICSVCKNGYELSLLEIRKKIIYLDQNFFSHVYKNEDKKNTAAFLKRFEHLSKLVQKQLLICPYSDAHDKETHLFREKNRLWKFIKQTSRGKRFYLRSKIEIQQLTNAYVNFIRNKPKKSEMFLSDAIEPSIHDWDPSLRVELDWSITNFIDPNSLIQDKIQIAEAIVKALPQWRDNKSSLEDNFNLEVRNHACILFNTFLKIKASGNIQKQLENEKYRKINTLLEIGRNEAEKSYDNVKNFLFSKHFENIPYINISAGLWAILKDKIKKKQFLIEQTKNEVIFEKVRGIPSDIEHLSVFAPYCDAVFTEKTMAGWLEEWKQHSLGGYTFKIFSVKNWDEFDAYLDEIENNITPEMQEELEIVYGS